MGFTVIVKFTGVPVHAAPPFVKVGVTAMVATRGAVPVLVVVNAGIVKLVPLAAKPMPGSLFVHV